MARGSKSSYTSRQKRQAEHIEESYEKRGTSKGEAERRAWATVNKETDGGKKSGSGRGKKQSTASSKKGGKIGGAKTKSRTSTTRSSKPGPKKSSTRKITAKKAATKRTSVKRKVGRPKKK